MDRERFDALAKLIGVATSRRGLLSLLIGIMSAPEARDVAADRGRKRHRRRNQHSRSTSRRREANARAAAKPPRCFPGAPCIPGPSANLSTCNFSGSSSLKGVNLKGANLRGANLTSADASGANMESVNLDKACLVGANLSGARITSSTNVSTAIFCRTTMPDGSINDAGCRKESACCATCGAVGLRCCTGSACDSGLACDASNTCVVCGDLTAPCCPTGGGSGTCEAPLVCAADGVCVPCGQEDAACCADLSCANGDLACDIERVCVPCGVEDGPCCAGRVCDGDLVCFVGAGLGPNGLCLPCGASGEDCCPGATCDSPDLYCVGARCTPCDVCASGCPFDSVDAAIAAAGNNAQIVICPGIYRTNAEIAQQVLTLVGVGAGPTLDGGNAGPVLAASPDSQEINLFNLTIQNGRGELGGGLRFSRNAARVQDCRIQNNTATTSGGGIYSFFAATTLVRTTVSGNSAPEGGGIFNHSSPLELRNNSHVTGNTATGGVGSGGGVKVISLGTFAASGGSTVSGNTPDDCVGC